GLPTWAARQLRVRLPSSESSSPPKPRSGARSFGWPTSKQIARSRRQKFHKLGSRNRLDVGWVIRYRSLHDENRFMSAMPRKRRLAVKASSRRDGRTADVHRAVQNRCSGPRCDLQLHPAQRLRSALVFGGLPEKDAPYLPGTPARNDGATIHELT